MIVTFKKMSHLNEYIHYNVVLPSDFNIFYNNKASLITGGTSGFSPAPPTTDLNSPSESKYKDPF